MASTAGGRRRPLVAAARRPQGHLEEIRAEEAAVEAVETAAAELVGAARQAVGTGAPDTPQLRLGAAFQVSQAGWFLVLALAAFVAVDQAVTFSLSVLGPEIRSTLGLSEAAYGIAVSQRATAAVLASFQFAGAIHLRGHRKLLVLNAAIGTGIGAVLCAFTSSFWPLFLAVAISSPTAGAVWACHRPMVMDGYIPQVRVRAMCLHQAGIVAGAVLGPVLVGALSGWAGLSWRGVILVVGLTTVIVALLAIWLRDPAPGRHDTDAIREAVRSKLGNGGAAAGDAAGLRFTETLRRIWLVPTVRALLIALAVLGIVVTPLLTYMSFFLKDHWRMGLGARSAFLGGAWAFALPALAWFGPRGDAMFRRDPAELVAASARLFVLLAAALAVSVLIPLMPVAFIGFGVALAISALLVPSLTVVMLSIVAPKARPVAGALAATFLVAVGGLAGAMLLGGLDRRFGPGAAIAILAFPALVAAALVRRAAGTVNADLDQMLSDVVEEEEIRSLSHRGTRLPMLACRHIDFSYGKLQVLFGVNFTVDDDEMVALLGTNGAGKSTLLRVVSGLGLPTGGSVRFHGTDVTYLDPERRLAFGMGQIPGGKAVFGPLSVVENLQVQGYSHGRNRRAVNAGLEAAFDAFPRLAERRNQPSSTLSGGEQQMLALASALVVKYRLLLIDELSLGLAPKVVAELLEMVRRINAAGTAVVLVEQSVNVALSLVDHAYFMEKGEVKFDGNASDLLARPDLLRSVFLEGASKGLAGTNGASATSRQRRR